jgi:hypothetical protein
MDTVAISALLNDLSAYIPVQDIHYATDAVTVCAILTAVFKPPTSGALAAVWRVLNWIGLNVRFAKNAPPAA